MLADSDRTRSMKRSFTVIRASIHDYVGQHPKLYRGLSALHPTLRRRFVSADTDLVIDGYPRTANTFAYHAFLWPQGLVYGLRVLG